MGRTKAAVEDDGTRTAVQVRLDPARLRALDRLIERRQAALFGEGVEVTRASYLRGLLDREIEAAALNEPRTRTRGKAKR